jgi:hypothetical protein
MDPILAFRSTLAGGGKFSVGAGGKMDISFYVDHEKYFPVLNSCGEIFQLHKIKIGTTNWNRQD